MRSSPGLNSRDSSIICHASTGADMEKNLTLLHSKRLISEVTPGIGWDKHGNTTAEIISHPFSDAVHKKPDESDWTSAIKSWKATEEDKHLQLKAFTLLRGRGDNTKMTPSDTIVWQWNTSAKSNNDMQAIVNRSETESVLPCVWSDWTCALGEGGSEASASAVTEAEMFTLWVVCWLTLAAADEKISFIYCNTNKAARLHRWPHTNNASCLWFFTSADVCKATAGGELMLCVVVLGLRSDCTAQKQVD